MLYPPTANEDAPNDTDEESSEEEVDDECVNVRKVKRKDHNSEFADNFVFEVDEGNQDADDLRSLRPYLKKNVTSTLQEKIDRERVKLLDKISFEDEEDYVIQEMKDIPDSVREKDVRKKKQNDSNESFFDEPTGAMAIEAGSSLTFSQMNLSRPLLKAVTACGFVEPTRIQAACIPLALAGRDLCACAATGTGKTAAFMLPILERLLYKPKQKSLTRVVVLTPTRELAIQIFQVSRQLSRFIQVDICLCAGGLDIKAQEAALRLGPDIVISTPGRLIDHLHNAPSFSLHDVEVLVLDEADRMLEEAFADQMKELIRLCSKNRQTLLFSATMTDQVEDLASMSLKNPVKLFVNENTETATNLQQEFIRIRENRENDRESIVAALVTRTFPDHTIVFVRTKKSCQRLHIVLGLLGIKVGQLHSSLSQTQRIETLSRFKKAELDVLVSTDLASRGLDIEGISTVINMDMPLSLKQYVHRVGRTARAGRTGRSVSLVGEGERKVLKEIVASSRGSKLKQRVIGAAVIDAYAKRIAAMKESIERVEEEEKEERALRLAEAELKRGEDRLQGNVQTRRWFQSESEQQKQKVRLKLEHKKKMGQKKKQAVEVSPEESSLKRLADFQAREAKRARKRKRIRAVVEDTDYNKSRGGTKTNRKRKSSFAKQLTSISTKAVKRFRHGPSDQDFKAAKLMKMKKRKKR